MKKQLIYLILALGVATSSCVREFPNNEYDPLYPPTTGITDTCNGEYFVKLNSIAPLDGAQLAFDDGSILFVRDKQIWLQSFDEKSVWIAEYDEFDSLSYLGHFEDQISLVGHNSTTSAFIKVDRYGKQLLNVPYNSSSGERAFNLENAKFALINGLVLSVYSSTGTLINDIHLPIIPDQVHEVNGNYFILNSLDCAENEPKRCLSISMYSELDVLIMSDTISSFSDDWKIEKINSIQGNLEILIKEGNINPLPYSFDYDFSFKVIKVQNGLASVVQELETIISGTIPNFHILNTLASDGGFTFIGDADSIGVILKLNTTSLALEQFTLARKTNLYHPYQYYLLEYNYDWNDYLKKLPFSKAVLSSNNDIYASAYFRGYTGKSTQVQNLFAFVKLDSDLKTCY